MLVNYYEILGVPEDADLIQITAAWKRLHKKHQADFNPEDVEATEPANFIDQAFEVLSDSIRRAQFDAKLAEQKRAASTDSSSFQPPQDFGKFNGADNETSKTHQSDQSSAENGDSFASKSRSKSRQGNLAALMTVVGIVLGAVTAIPIGLFLVWTISGFDPLGIFRLPNETFAERTDPENANVENANPAKSGAEKTSGEKSTKEQTENKSGKSNTSSQKEKDKSTVSHLPPAIDKLDSAPPKDLTPKASKKTEDLNSKPIVAQPANPPAAKSANSKETVTPPVKTAVSTRIAVPDSAQVAKVKVDIAGKFKSEYEQAMTKKGFERLVKLRFVANKVYHLLPKEEDAVAAYAIFEVAIGIARQSCFAEDALRMVDAFEQRYEVDGMAMRAELFGYWQSQLARTIKDPEEKRKKFTELVKITKPFTDKVVAAKNWKLAIEFSELLRKYHVAAGDRESATKIEKTIPKFEMNLEDETEALKLIAELKINPDQPAKRLPVGCYYCFAMDDWQTGLQYFKDSNHEKLSRCAAEELKANPASSELIGDLWWELADNESFKRYKKEVQVRATNHYTKALANADPITRAKLKQRIREIYPLPRITIVKASFGWNRKWTDATASLKKILKRDPPVFVNSARGMGVPDPIPKIRKVTKITYTINGKQKGITLKAGPSRRYNLYDQLK